MRPVTGSSDVYQIILTVQEDEVFSSMLGVYIRKILLLHKVGHITVIPTGYAFTSSIVMYSPCYFIPVP